MRNDRINLERILHVIARISAYTAGGQTEFMASPLIQDAVVRNLQIVGQAVKKLSNKLLTDNPHVEWSNAAKMRDKLIHDYDDVDYQIVWNTVAEHLPKFRAQLEDIIAALPHEVNETWDGFSLLDQKLREARAREAYSSSG